MLNPFALHGTDFLAFYAGLGILAVALQYFLSRAVESPGLQPQLAMTDPYQIAYLRAGMKEALRIVVISLIDRGLLHATRQKLVAELDAEKLTRRPIEKAALRAFRRSGGIKRLFSDAGAQAACEQYRETLTDFYLIAGPRVFARRFIPFLLSAATVVFAGVLKISIALSEGRHNIGFTILLMIGFTVACILIFRRHRTRLGDAVMRDLRSLFTRLRGRASMLRQGGATNEAALLAAVFGAGELSPDRFPTEVLYPKKKKTDNSYGCSSGSSCSSSGSWSSSSSSCGSSGGDSGGCGGGGGGCGGGCGG